MACLAGVTLNEFCTMIFTAEALLKVYGFGWEGYVSPRGAAGGPSSPCLARPGPALRRGSKRFPKVPCPPSGLARIPPNASLLDRHAIAVARALESLRLAGGARRGALPPGPHINTPTRVFNQHTSQGVLCVG